MSFKTQFLLVTLFYKFVKWRHHVPLLVSFSLAVLLILNLGSIPQLLWYISWPELLPPGQTLHWESGKKDFAQKCPKFISFFSIRKSLREKTVKNKTMYVPCSWSSFVICFDFSILGFSPKMRIICFWLLSRLFAPPFFEKNLLYIFAIPVDTSVNAPTYLAYDESK